TIGQEAGLVGGHAIGFAAIAFDVIGAGQIAGRLARFERHSEWPIRIGAAVNGDLSVEREQAAAVVGKGLQLIMVLPAVRARDQMLATILNVAERALERQRKPG